MANRGDELLKVLTADFITKLEHLLNLIGRQGSFGLNDPPEFTTITVANHEAVAKQKYEPVALGTPAITYTGAVNHRHERIVYNTKALTDTEPDNWVILQEPLPGKIGAEAQALVVGVSWLKTQGDVASDSDRQYVQVNSTEAVFKPTGKAKALYSYSDGSTYTTLVIMGHGWYELSAIFAVPAGGIAAVTGSGPWTATGASCTRVTGTAGSLSTGVEIETVYNVSSSDIAEGDLVVAHKIDGEWYVGGSGGGGTPTTTEPVQRLFCLLSLRTTGDTTHFAADPRESDAILNTATIVRLSSDPFSVMPDLSAGTVPNPQQLTAISGDGAILEYNYTTGAYFLAQVFPQQQLELWVELAADAPYGSLQPAVSCNPKTPIGIGAMPSTPFDAYDKFFQAINAKAGHKALVKYDYKDQKYYIIACEHTATKVIGQVVSDADSTPTTISVETLVGLNGLTPTTDPLSVSNRFSVEFFKAGDTVEIAWDCISGTWYLMQAEAPEDPTPTYVN